jgi:hypothetical protein
LQGGGSILKKESVDELFRPQIGEGSRKALKAMVLGAGLAGVWGPTDMKPDELMQIDHTLCGTINSRDVPGRRHAGTVNWGGLPNLLWWIDREAGVAATFFTQIMPAGDAVCGKIASELEEALYSLVDENRK